MAITIAISGKGGTGKTTLAAMIIRSLLAKPGRGAILAVDADPNSCLGLTLGVQPASTVAEIREQARSKAPTTGGMDRVRSVEYGIQQAITEADGFDLLTMGRPEGPSCYCAVNNMLRQFLDKLSSQYQYVIIDNEAGMEHLSRRTTNNVELLCIVAEPTSLGAVTVRRISELAGKLPITVGCTGVIWNKIAGSGQRIADSNGVELIGKEKLNAKCYTLNAVETFGAVPADPAVLESSMQGKTVFDLDEDNPALTAVRKILEDKLAGISNMK